MIRLLRFLSRLAVLVVLVTILTAVLTFFGPPEWTDRQDIEFTLSVAKALSDDPDALQRLNFGTHLKTVLPDDALRLEKTGLTYLGGVLVLPTKFDTAHYYDIQGACWNFDPPRFTTLVQCPR